MFAVVYTRLTDTQLLWILRLAFCHRHTGQQMNATGFQYILEIQSHLSLMPAQWALYEYMGEMSPLILSFSFPGLLSPWTNTAERVLIYGHIWHCLNMSLLDILYDLFQTLTITMSLPSSGCWEVWCSNSFSYAKPISTSGRLHKFPLSSGLNLTNDVPWVEIFSSAALGSQDSVPTNTFWWPTTPL